MCVSGSHVKPHPGSKCVPATSTARAQVQYSGARSTRLENSGACNASSRKCGSRIALSVSDPLIRPTQTQNVYRSSLWYTCAPVDYYRRPYTVLRVSVVLVNHLKVCKNSEQVELRYCTLSHKLLWTISAISQLELF